MKNTAVSRWRTVSVLLTADATAICPYVGYETAVNISKEALRPGRQVRDLILEKGLMDEKQLNTVLNPYTMTEPGILGKDPMDQLR